MTSMLPVVTAPARPLRGALQAPRGTGGAEAGDHYWFCFFSQRALKHASSNQGSKMPNGSALRAPGPRPFLQAQRASLKAVKIHW